MSIRIIPELRLELASNLITTGTLARLGGIPANIISRGNHWPWNYHSLYLSPPLLWQCEHQSCWYTWDLWWRCCRCCWHWSPGRQLLWCQETPHHPCHHHTLAPSLPCDQPGTTNQRSVFTLIDQSEICIYLDILLTNIERVFWMLESWVPIIDVDQRDLDTGCIIVPEKSVSTGWFIINVSSPSIISSNIEVVTLSCLIVNSLPQYDLSSAVDTELLLRQLLVVDIELNWSETTNQK